MGGAVWVGLIRAVAALQAVATSSERPIRVATESYSPKDQARDLRFLRSLGIDVVEDLRAAVATGAFDDAPNLPEILAYLVNRDRHGRRGVSSRFEAVLPMAASLSELSPFQASGPPPPPRPALDGQLIRKETTVEPHESAADGWLEAKVKAWRETEGRAGRYEGPNGREAVRFLTRDVPLWIVHHPSDVDAADCREVVQRLRERAQLRGRRFTNNSARTYLDWLNSYLWRLWGNRVVRDSGIRSEFPKKASKTPVATAEQWERVARTAIGVETVVVAWVWPNRRVEARRLRLSDCGETRASWDARCKGGHGEVTDPDTVLTDTQRTALRTYLPWRRGLAADSRCLFDTGLVVCRRWWVRAADLETRTTRILGFGLVGVSDHTMDRILARAVARAYPDMSTRPRIPAHSFRRGGLTTLHDRTIETYGFPDWEATQAAAHHRSMATTELYVKSLLLRRRLPDRIRLLDPRPMGG